jgi:hypothetical protein
MEMLEGDLTFNITCHPLPGKGKRLGRPWQFKISVGSAVPLHSAGLLGHCQANLID